MYYAPVKTKITIKDYFLFLLMILFLYGWNAGMNKVFKEVSIVKEATLEAVETKVETASAESFQKADVPPNIKESQERKSPSSSPTSIEEMIKTEFGEEADNAILVANCESSMNPKTIGDKHLKHYSYGLFQINTRWHPYTEKQLLEPEFNIKIAKQIYDRGGWERWTCGRKLIK